MKNFKEKYRLWKYSRSPAFKRALAAANKKLQEINQKYNVSK